MRVNHAGEIAAQALYHDLDLTQLYRVDTNGQVLQTIPVSDLEGAQPLTIGLVNALVWNGRLHYRLLKPALEPQS